MNAYASHVREAHQRSKLRGMPDLSAASQGHDVSPALGAALSRMMPTPERPPVAVNRWDVKKIDSKYRVAVTLGKQTMGWDEKTSLWVTLDGMCLVLTDQPSDEAVIQVRADADQSRVVVPRQLSDPLRLVPGQQVFLEADVVARQVRLYPAGLVEVAAAAATTDAVTDEDQAA